MARKTVDPTEQALAEIREAKETGKTKISINATNLDVVRAVCEVTTIEDLRLSGELTELPDEIGKLVNLQDISIESNRLTTLPAAFGDLVNLTALRAYSNKLVTLPPEIGKLKKLKKAVLWSNELRELPRTIGQLESLVELELKRNKLARLPDEIGQLAALEQLEIDNNELIELPRTLGGMIKLFRLTLSENKLAVFPPGLLDLPALRELDLSENEITAIPDDIARLAKLEELNLAKNRITALPTGLYDLHALASLDLTENAITHVDKGIGKLRTLTTLTLEDNPVENVPEEAIKVGKDAIFEHLGLAAPSIVEGDLPPPAELKEIVKQYQPRLDQFVRECKKKSHAQEMLPKLVDFLVGKTSVVPPIRRDDHYGFSTLPRHLAKITEWTFVDRRIVRYIGGAAWYYRQPGHDYFTGYYDDFYNWVAPQLEAEGEGGDVFFRAVAALKTGDLDDEGILRSSLREIAKHVMHDGKPTSFGRWVLEQVPTKLSVISAMAGEYNSVRDGVTGLLVEHAFEAFEKIADKLLEIEVGESDTHAPHGAYEKLCAVNPERYTPLVLDAIGKTSCLPCCAELSVILAERCGPAHRDRARSLSIETLSAISDRRNKEDRMWFPFGGRYGTDGISVYVDWVLRTFKTEVKDAALAFAENTKVFDLDVAEAIAKNLGQDGVDALAEGLKMTFDSDDIAPHFRRMFAMLAPLDWSKYHDKAWELARSEYKQVRQTACMALSRLAPDLVLPKALEMIEDKLARVREAGVLIASLLPGGPAEKKLAELLADETSDDVRDLVVAKVYASDAAKFTIADAGKRVASAKERGKLAKPVAKWLDEKKLGALVLKGGQKSDKKADVDTVRFLLHRQTRLADIGPEPEARAIYALVDREKSAGFASKLLALAQKNGGISAKTRFALSVVGLTGNEDVIETLEEVAVDAHNENAATTLGLLGSLEAARALDRIMKVFRIKYPNVREAAQDAFDRIAQAMGITRFELADQMIPDLGFKKGQGKITLGKVKATVTIGADRKLEFRDSDDKLIKSPGKGLTGKAKEALEALRDEVDSASRTLRTNLEYYLVAGRRWQADKWRAFFLGNPLASAFARSLVWSCNGQPFRIVDDKPADREGSAVTLEKAATISLVHPLDLDKAERDAWQALLAGDGLEPPFAQMTRPVFAPKPDDAARTISFEFENKELEGLTFKSRAERLGWRRGSVVDSGAVSAYRKLFERQQIEAFIGTENLGVTSYDGGEVTLEELFFVKAGAVVTGSYTYDEPRDQSDQRLIKLGDVPAIVYSETIADLHTVTREAAEA